MRRLFFGLVLSVCVVPAALAQLTATLTINNFTKAGGNYSFDIWARRTNATGQIFVGISSFLFTYNATALGSPSLSNVNAKYTGVNPLTEDYGPMGVGIVAGKIAVTVNFAGNATGAGSPLSTSLPDGEMICRVTLPITNPTLTADLAWDMGNSAISTSNSQPVGHNFVGSDNNLLPIQLVSFSATQQQESGSVLLTWSTASETNNYGFEVEKREEGDDTYQTIANSFVAGNGTTVEAHSYSYTDATVAPGVWYYRLKQIDLDGATHYSDGIRPTSLTDVKDRAVPTSFALDQNYPNPFNPSTTIEFALPKESQVTLEVYDVLGQRVATLVDDVRPAGYYVQRFDASALGTGVYFYRLSAGENSFLKKMLLVK